MKIKIKKLSSKAVIPSYAKLGDAGLDLTAISKTYDEYGNVSYGTGIAIEIPEGYVGLLFPRSSNCKTNLNLTNSVGVVDSGYRGELFMKFKGTVICTPPENNYKNHEEQLDYLKSIHNNINNYNAGDRIGQLVIIPYPQIEFEEVKELNQSQRGDKGFGSTNKK